MSTYLSTFIEYKNKDENNGKWHLLKLYGPFKHHTTSTYEDGKWVEHQSNPDIVLPDNTELDCTYEESYQGGVRDFFSSRSFSKADFTGRGLPDDMSDELKAYFDKEYKEIEEKKAAGETWCGKWWWDETWCTLSELNSAADKMFDKFKSDLDKYIVKREACKYTEKINKKLDTIISLVKSAGTEVPKFKKNRDDSEEWTETDYQEYIDELWENDFWDALAVQSFASHIYTLASDYAEIYGSDNIRVVSYIS